MCFQLSTEHIAAIAFLDEEHNDPAVQDPNDNNSYTLGRYGEHNTVIAVLPAGEYGKSSAATVARDMLRSFPNIRVGLMVGIGGGAPNLKNDNDIRLGDVVVSTPSNGKGGVLHYDMVQRLQTKYKIDGHQLEESIQAVLQRKPRLRKEYSRPSHDNDRLYRNDIVHRNNLCCEATVEHDASILVKRPQRDAEDSLVVHYGLIASGDTLMKNAVVRDRLSEDKNILCFEMEAAGLMNHFPCLVVRGICDYSDTHKNKKWQGYAAMTATAYAKDLLARMPTSGIVNIGEKVVKINENTTIIDQKMILNLLPVAYGAMYDSHSEENNQFCLPDTRGREASTIARTLSRSFSESRQLGASFFFKRGEADRSIAAKFFTTIAAQLSRAEPAMAPYIKDALDDDPSIVKKSLAEQFKGLDFQQQKSLLIVVDALDECDMEDDIRLPPRMGFDNLSGKYEKLILHEIRRSLGVRKAEYNNSVKDEEPDLGALLDITLPLFISAATICRFLFDRYVSGSPATKLRAVLDQHKMPQGSPASSGLLPTRPHETKLNAVYQPILAQMLRSLSGQRREEALTEFRIIVGSIVVLATPLSTSALARLLNIEEVIIENRLDHLHSVLSVPAAAEEPIKFFHLSFRDFLLGPEKLEKPSFWIDAGHTHQQLKTNCLRVMEDSLKKDMCSLYWPASACPSSERVDECLPPEVRYACQYWVHHTEQAGGVLRDDEVHGFLKVHLLHWLEAMALLGRIDEALMSVRSLRSKLQRILDDALRFILTNIHIVRTTPLQIYSSALVFAPKESITESRWSACLHTLEGHQGGVRDVAFSPDGTLIASASSDGTIQLCLISTGSCKQVIQQPDAKFLSVTFSPDGARLASVSIDGVKRRVIQLCDCETRLWSRDAGGLRNSSILHDAKVASIAFSANSKLVVTVSYGGLISTGKLLQTLQGDKCAFSPDSKLVATTTTRRNNVNIWSVQTGALQQTLECTTFCRCLAFSLDATLLATGHENGNVQLWSVHQATEGDNDKNQPQASLANRNGENESVKLLAFSPDERFVISAAAGDDTVLLWNATKGSLEHRLLTTDGHMIWDGSIRISPDSQLVAAVAAKEKERYGIDRSEVYLYLWSATTGSLLQSVKGHCVAFTPDSTVIAIASPYREIQLWSITGLPGRGRRGHGLLRKLRYKSNFRVVSIKFSCDSQLFASAADDGSMRIWSTSGTLLREYNYPYFDAAVAFSPDSRLIAIRNKSTEELLLISTTDFQPHKRFEARGLFGVDATAPVMTFSPDSSLVAVDLDYDIVLWSVSTGTCLQSLDILPFRVNRLSFDKTSQFLPSNIGTLRLPREELPNTTIEITSTTPDSISDQLPRRSLRRPEDRKLMCVGYGISADMCWITLNGEDLLWLPADFRPFSWERPKGLDVSNSQIAFSTETKRLVIIGFSDSLCHEALPEDPPALTPPGLGS
ncbi:putative wd40 protein [Xylaria longipes]|nr:putative wd40 protein [Xylaria longipes]